MKSVAKTIDRPIDELILENNQLPSLPGKFLSPLRVVRLMLRHNGIERLANGWLNDLEDSLVEVFIVERELRNVPLDSMMGLRKLEAVTIQSESLKRVPIFSGLKNLRYVKVQSNSLVELAPNTFRDMPNLETVQIIGSSRLNRLEAGLFNDLPKMKYLNVAENGISWIHLRALSGLQSLKTIELSSNKISDAGMVGRALKDLNGLEELKLDRNHITRLSEGSFVDLPALRELLLNDNAISEIYHGAFHRTPMLKLIHLENNFLSRVHPESFLLRSGSGVEYLHIQNNEIARVEELRSLLDALPMLKFLDLSNNQLQEVRQRSEYFLFRKINQIYFVLSQQIPFGAIRGHGTLEQLYLDNNLLKRIERDAFLAMPALRELRMKNNSLSESLPLPFWNLPGLKGLDLSKNQFRRIDPMLLMGLPSLRSLDISLNYLSTLDPSSFANTPLLETINISRNELSMIHPSTFHKLDHLFEIDASYNNLQEFIPGLPSIVERVSLKRNKISSLPVSPNKAFDLPNLRMLDIGSNMVQRIPRSAFKSLPQLRYLSLAKNRIQTIDETSLHGLERLEILNLRDNRIMAMHEKSMQSLEEIRDLNIQGNRIELFVDGLLSNLQRLERLDLSRNNLIEVQPNSFRNTRSLRSLDISENNLRDLPESIMGLSDLRELDVSFNRLSGLSPVILSSLRQLEELRASNNKVLGIPQGTFRDLPVLQYLDISSNELNMMEAGSIRNLPQLQEIVLADNRLVELGDRIFEELPNLQAVHLQQNNLRYISPNSFIRSPSIVYLNISSNHFRNLEHVGLRSVRNLEVLDLSNNGIKRITTNPLRDLDWLVELKLDDNRICKVQGEPFSTMPRLRVLTMRNNKMSTIVEPTFRSLRGNLAVLDLDGNPLDCGCETIWLRAWYQETDSLTHYPGPRCRDGTMLRESRLSRSECQTDERSNNIPLTNEHGDLFSRQIPYDECEPDGLDDPTNNYPPSPVDSEYFDEQYIDYPINETHLAISNTSGPIEHIPSLNGLPGTNLSNTILNYNKHQQLLQQHQQQQAPGSQFTFFGMPLPSLNIGNLWNNGRSATNRANNRAAAGTKGKARVQVYRPEDLEIFKFLNNQRDPQTDKKIDPRERNSLQTLPDRKDEDFNFQYRPYFQTPFVEPPRPIEKGGFVPIVPGTTGGFTPIQNPYENSTDQSASDENQSSESTLIKIQNNRTEEWNDRFPVPIISESPKVIDYEADQSDSKLVASNEQSFAETEVTKVTTLSPLQNFLADLTAPRYEESQSTTSTYPESTVRAEPTVSVPSSTTYKGPAYLPESTTSNIKKLADSPSSLSALVAPGAQLANYRPPGRSTITKIFSSTPIPIAEEYQRTTSDMRNDNKKSNFNEMNSVTTTDLTPEETTRKANMDWYYANYNKSLDEGYDIGLNSLRSGGNFSHERFSLLSILLIGTVSSLLI